MTFHFLAFLEISHASVLPYNRSGAVNINQFCSHKVTEHWDVSVQLPSGSKLGT